MLFAQYLGAWLATLLTGAGFGAVMSGAVQDPRATFGMGLAGAVVGVPWCLLVVRWLWRRPAAWMGSRFEGRGLTRGLVLGVILPFVVVAVLAALGVARVSASPLRDTEKVMLLAGQLGWALFVGTSEEHVYRGMAVREWAARIGWAWATALGGFYFALVHAGGVVGAGPVEIAQFVLGAQAVNFMVVALYLCGRSLWLPIGVHAGWNFALEGLAGARMSGRPALGLLDTELSGPGWMTGGRFGPEVSVVAIAVYVVVGLAALLWRRPRPGSAAWSDATAG